MEPCDIDAAFGGQDENPLIGALKTRWKSCLIEVNGM